MLQRKKNKTFAISIKLLLWSVKITDKIQKIRKAENIVNCIRKSALQTRHT